jgi:glycosyltransferase involved in cell wall biosynthesis
MIHPNTRNMTCIATLVTNDYLHQALTLLSYAKSTNEEADFIVFTIGRITRHNYSVLLRDGASYVVEMEDIVETRLFNELTTRYSPFELSCALRPWCHEYLFQHTSYSSWVFIDSDVAIVGSILEVSRTLHNYDIFLTAHIKQPHLLANVNPNEINIITHGLYNGGVLGMSRSDTALKVITFLKDRFRHYSENSRGRLASNDSRQHDGLFVDQLWLNLVPLLFDNVYVSKDEIFNLGHWNLWQGEIDLDQSNNTAYYNGKPVSILHFSGLNPFDLSCVSKYSTLYNDKPNHTWALLAEQYIYNTQISRSKLESQEYPYLPSGSCSKKLVVFIELSVLGLAELNNLARTGIFFYIRNIVESLSIRDDIRLIPFSGDCHLLHNTFSACTKLNLDTSLLHHDPVVKLLFSVAFRFSRNPLRHLPLVRRLLYYCSSAFSSVAVKLYHHRTRSLIRSLLIDNKQHSSGPTLGRSTSSHRLVDSLVSKLKNLVYGHLPPKRALVHFTHRCHEWITAPHDLNSTLQRIVTSYDLIPHLHPEFCDSVEPGHFNEFLRSIRPTDFVLAISHSTKNDLVNALNYVDHQRVFVTPLAASKGFSLYPEYESANVGITPPTPILQLPSKYILSVATLEPRKNTKLLLEAFAKIHSSIPSTDVSLVLVGGKGWVKDDLASYSKRLGVSDNVVFTGYLPDEVLPTVYSQALFFVYPSLYEGFGLPVLEAMQCGLPVITSNNSSLAEIATNAALLVDATSCDELTTAIETLLSDSNLRDRLRRAGISRASAYSWTSTATATVKAYNKALACS